MFGFEVEGLLVALSCIIFFPTPIIYLLKLWGLGGAEPMKPTPATWITWSIVGTINTAFYGLNVDVGDEWLLYFTAYTNVMIIGVTIFVIQAYRKRRVAEGLEFTFEKIDKISLGLSALIVLGFAFMYSLPRTKEVAAVLIQVPMLIGFVPTYAAIITGRGKEPWQPFLLAIFSYIPQIGAVYVSDEASWALYAWPVLNGIIGNGLVVLFSWKQPFFRRMYLNFRTRWRSFKVIPRRRIRR